MGPTVWIGNYGENALHTTFMDRPLASIACADNAQIGDGLKTIRIAPAGEVQSRKGVFLLDREAASLIIAAYAKHATPLVIDYEHQSLGGEFSAPDGRAIAAGWVEKIWFDDTQGLLGLVRWNDAARQSIQRDEYRYLSPVVLVRKSDNRAVALHSAALTNVPAIDGMDRLAASNRPENKEVLTMADQPQDRKEAVEPGIIMGQLSGALGIDAGNMSPNELLLAILEKVKQLVSGDADGGSDSASANSDRLLLADTPGESGGESPMMLLGQITTELGLTIENPRNVVAVLQQVLEAIKGSAKNSDGESDTEETANSDSATLATLQKQIDDNKLDRFLQPYINRGVLDPTQEQDFKIFRDMAARDETEAAYILDSRLAMLPRQGQTTAPDRQDTSRRRVIDKAVSEFKADERHAKGTTCDAFVNLSLRDEGLSPMTDDELTQIPQIVR